MKKRLILLFLSPFLLFAHTDERPLSHHYEKIEDQSHLSILTPTLAKRKTAKIRLNNKLEVYLVSDPDIEQSSAGLAVEVGSWQDPPEYPGMAHFLEHMLFMGTKKYPKESEYMQYIGDSGGKVNAYTAADRTVYMFSVNNDAFVGALDRFAHFFIDPLFSPSSIDRELYAVDQEHSKNIENDFSRQAMVFKETANPLHPVTKFSTGNAATLQGIPQEVMKKWYKQHYSADKMHLIVLSSLPLEEMISLVVEDFSAIATSTTAWPSSAASITSETQRGHILYLKPVKDLKILSLSWEIPFDLSQTQDTKTAELIAYVLQNGSSNSLFSLLKKEQLAEDLFVAEESFSKNHKLFSIDIKLTEKGLQKTDEVITYCFEALARLKKTGIPLYIYEEVKRIAELKYEYQSRIDAFDFIQKTAGELIDEQLETFPRKTALPTVYDPDFTQRYLRTLSPENGIYFVLADPAKTKVLPTHTEKWVGAEYALKTVSQKQLTSWTQASLNPHIGLPPENPFIPKNLELVSHLKQTETPISPLLIKEDIFSKIYFAPDNAYLTPEVFHSFRLHTPSLDGSAKNIVLGDLYLKALDEALFPAVSNAENVGFKVSLAQEKFSIAIGISGYSQTAPLLMKEVFSCLQKVNPTKEEWELLKQSLTASYENASKELPIAQSMELLASILFNNAPTNGDKLEALNRISYEEFNEFQAKLFAKTYIEGLFYGNLVEEEAEKLCTLIKNTLKTSAYPLEKHHKRQVLLLSEGQGPYMVIKPTAMQGNAALLLIEEGEYNFEKRASHQILGKVLKETFWDTLRTKQQTGYIVRAQEKQEEGQLLQLFVVQSSSHQPTELLSRFELFLEDFLRQFTVELPQERFENIRSMAVATLKMPPENLSLMGARLFSLAFDFGGDFQMIDKRIEALEKLKYEQLKTAAQEFLSRKNTRRIAVLIEGISTKEGDFRYELASKEEIRDQGTFVAWK